MDTNKSDVNVPLISNDHKKKIRQSTIRLAASNMIDLEAKKNKLMNHSKTTQQAMKDQQDDDDALSMESSEGPYEFKISLKSQDRSISKKSVSSQVADKKEPGMKSSIEQYLHYCREFREESVECWKSTDSKWFKDSDQLIDDHIRHMPGLMKAMNMNEADRDQDMSDISDGLDNKSNRSSKQSVDLSADQEEKDLVDRNAIENDFCQNDKESDQDDQMESCEHETSKVSTQNAIQNMQRESRRFFRYVYQNGHHFKMFISSWHTVNIEIKSKLVKDFSDEYKKEWLTYFIKTIKIFDIFQKKCDEVFVEAIKVQQPLTKECQQGFATSILQFGNHLYFFRRRIDNETEKSLVLTKLKLGESKPMNICKCMIEEPDGIYYNTIFSQSIKHDNSSPANEQEYLESQFVLIQAYPTNSNLDSKIRKSFKIYRLKDLLNQNEISIYDSREDNYYKDPIYQFYHLAFEEHDLIQFLVADSHMAEIHVYVNDDEESEEDEQMQLQNGKKKNQQYHRQDHELLTNEVYQQPTNLKTSVDHIRLRLNEEEEEECFYFRVEENNKVMLIYPIPYEKIQQLKVLQKIMKKLEQNDQENFKEDYSAVLIQDYHSCKIKSVGQPTSRLTDIFGLCTNDKQLSNELKSGLQTRGQRFFFSYCEDINRQMLTVIEPFSKDNYLKCFYLKDHSCICSHKNNRHLLMLEDSQKLQKIKMKLNQIKFPKIYEAVNQNVGVLRQPLMTNVTKTMEINQECKLKPEFSRDAFFSSAKSIMKESTDKTNPFIQHAEQVKASIYDFEEKEYHEIVIYDQDQLKHMFNIDQNYQLKSRIELVWYQQHSRGYLFVFVLEIKNEQQGSQLNSLKSYIFLNAEIQYLKQQIKKKKEILKISKAKAKMNFINVRYNEKRREDEIYLDERLIVDEWKRHISGKTERKGMKYNEPEQEQARIRLHFPQCPDQRYFVDFTTFAIIWKTNKTQRAIVVYDFIEEQFKHELIQMRYRNSLMLDQGEDEMGSVTLCQTSDLVEIVDDPLKRVKYMKYSVIRFFNKDLGIIKIQDFIISSTGKGKQRETSIRIVGVKHLFLSNQVIKDCNFQFMTNMSFSIPNYKKIILQNGQEGNQKSRTPINGCYLILFMKVGQIESELGRLSQKTTGQQLPISSSDETHIIDLQDNPVRYESLVKSNVVKLYDYKIQLSKSKRKSFIQVVQTRLTDRLIHDDCISSTESQFIIEKLSSMQIGCRLPDLRYFVENTFEKLITKDLFQRQMLFHGQSLCDVMLQDFQKIVNAIKHFSEVGNLYGDAKENLNSKTLLYYINQDEPFREKMIEQLSFYDRYQVIGFDFDFNGTIKKALEMNAPRTIQVLLDFIFQKQNHSYYNDCIMVDFNLIIKDRNLNLELFFDRKMAEQINDRQEHLCCFEQFLDNPQLPAFSDCILEDKLVINSNIFSAEMNEDFTQQILKGEEDKHERGTVLYRVEHCYINFSMPVLKQKLASHSSDYKMTNLELARLVELKASSNDLQFFKSPTIQKMIEIQWKTSKFYISIIFFVFLAYFGTFLHLCLIDHEDHMRQRKNLPYNMDNEQFAVAICSLCKVFLLVVEILQLSVAKWDYFKSFLNWIDMTDFVVFTLFMISFRYEMGDIKFGIELVKYQQFIKLTMLGLAFCKFIFYIRIYSKLGIIIRMVAECAKELIPFIFFFILFLLFFSFSLLVLNMEPDGEVGEAEFIGYVAKVILQTFRTSIGELGIPFYTGVLASGKSTYFIYANIYMIWAVWYVQTFTMLVVMLNFIIAVINETYEKNKNDQELIHYQYMATMNVECTQIACLLMEQVEFSHILLSVQCSDSHANHDSYKLIIDQVKKFVSYSSMTIHNELTSLQNSMSWIKQGQDMMISNMDKRFDQMIKSTAQMDVTGTFSNHKIDRKMSIDPANLMSLETQKVIKRKQTNLYKSTNKQDSEQKSKVLTEQNTSEFMSFKHKVNEMEKTILEQDKNIHQRDQKITSYEQRLNYQDRQIKELRDLVKQRPAESGEQRMLNCELKFVEQDRQIQELQQLLTKNKPSKDSRDQDQNGSQTPININSFKRQSMLISTQQINVNLDSSIHSSLYNSKSQEPNSSRLKKYHPCQLTSPQKTRMSFPYESSSHAQISGSEYATQTPGRVKGVLANKLKKMINKSEGRRKTVASAKKTNNL